MRKLTLLLLSAMWLGCSEGLSSPENLTQDAGPKEDASGRTECAASEEPTCCVSCTDMLVKAVCTEGSWSCPEGSRDERQCPVGSNGRACWGPPHPQETYTYPGCANEDYNCPRLKTVYCALNSIRAEHSACEQDSDCVAATVDGRCTGYGACPPAMVNASGRADFEAKANAELARYCTESPICRESGSCAFPTFIPRCKQGRCEAEATTAP